MNKTKFICLLLAMVTLAATACVNKGPSGNTNTGDTGTDPVSEAEMPDVPDKTFDGTSFKVIYQSGNYAYDIDDVWVEDSGSEPVSVAVYNRNSRLEDKFKIKLEASPNSDPVAFTRSDVMTGDHAVDVLTAGMDLLFPLGSENVLVDWNSLNYVDLSKSWWDQNAQKELSIVNKLFVMTGNLSMSAFSGARFIYYNKMLLADNQLKNPYELVRNNQWTFDEFSQMVRTVSGDLNGDLVMDANDRYGMMYENPEYVLSGLGVIYTSKDENDIPEVTCINDKTTTIISDLKRLFDDSQHTISWDRASAGMDTSGFQHVFDFNRYMFTTDHYLFIQNGANVAFQFSNMSSGYGILPNPKYDEAQTSYYHLVDPYCAGWGISSQTSNLEMVDILLEYWGYLSKDLVEAFYEITMRNKRADTPDDAEMLDVINASLRYEITTVYNIGVIDVIRDAFSTGNLMSSYSKLSDSISRRIELMEEAFSSVE